MRLIKTLFPLLKNDVFVFAAALETDLNTMRQCFCRSRRHLMFWRVEGRALAKVWEELGQKCCPPSDLTGTQSRACGCVKWAFGSSDAPSKREGKRHCEDVSTPMEFTGSVSVHWPSSQPDDWCAEASQSCDFLSRSPRMPQTMVRREQREAGWPTQKLHQSKSLSTIHPSTRS